MSRQPRDQRHRLVAANASNVFVVNTPGGGHAVLGFHLAKQLTADGHKVTIMVPGDEVRHGFGARTPSKAILY